MRIYRRRNLRDYAGEYTVYQVAIVTVSEQQTHHSPRQARGRHRRRPSMLFVWLRNFPKDSLVRNSIFLIINTVLTAASGFLAVSLLTHLYSNLAVGLSAAALSVGTLIGAISQFGMNFSLPRFLPTSNFRRELINTALTITIVVSIVGTFVFLALPSTAKFLTLGGILFVTLFIVGTSLDAAETQLEAIFIADRSADKIAFANSFANLLKIIAPPAFLFMGGCGAYASRIISGIATFVILAIILTRRGHKFSIDANLEATKDLRRFSAGAYIGGLLGGLPMMVLPIIVLSRFGPTQSAYWYVSMSIASVLYQLPGVVSRVLLGEISQNSSDRRYLVFRATKVMFVILVPVSTGAYFLAPVILSFFGGQYVEGSLAALRWLILAGLPAVLNLTSGAILFLAKKTFAVAVVNCTDAVLVPIMAMAWAHDIRDVAFCCLVGEIPTTVFFGLYAFQSLREVQYKWEDLGSVKRDGKPPEVGQPSTIGSQQEGLEALLKIAARQASLPIYDFDNFNDFS